MQAVVFRPQTKSQFNLLQELAKAMHIPFQLLPAKQAADKDVFLAEVAQAGFEAQQIANAQTEGQTLDSLLDELG